MFKTNLMSGQTYWEAEDTKISANGTIFNKSGSSWLGSNGDQIQEVGDQLMNLKTGVMSPWGDPFEDKK